jgi:hypothetical protein
MILTSIRAQHPFVYAKEKFLAGEMLVEQAIVMAARDNDFAYEALLNGMTGMQAAEAVVRNIWCKELCKIIAERKRGLALLRDKVEEMDSTSWSSSDQRYRMWEINNEEI